MQSFSLSLCGPISISRANAHIIHMGYKTSTEFLKRLMLLFWNISLMYEGQSYVTFPSSALTDDKYLLSSC